MSAGDNDEQTPGPEDSSQKAGSADFLAIGCGCLVTVLFFAAILWVAIVRG